MNETSINLIKEYFNNYSKHGICNALNNFFKYNSQIKDELEIFLNEHKNWESIRNIIYGIVLNQKLKHCKNCGIEMKYSKLCYDFCSTKCSNSYKEIQEKRKQTCLEKYGVEFIGKSQKIKEKIKQTCLEKYGVEHHTKSKEIYQKIKNTCLEKYGVEFTSKLPENREKFRQTCLKKYGVDNVSKVDKIKEKIKNTCIKKYGGNAPICSSEIYLKSQLTLKQNGNDRISEGEKELFNFCKQYFKNIKRSLPNELISKELDIVIDDIKLAIEFNGLYWHSLRSKNYHLNKTVECNQKGYRLIHIWEDEWDNDKEIIKQRLIDIFTGNEIIDYSKPLDRSWYNNLEGNFEETPPEIIKRGKFEVENCGYLILK